MRLAITSILLLAAAPAAAQHAGHQATADSAFAALQARGKAHMGVDQYASRHRFDTLADGGRVVLESERGDSADVATIRAHMRAIAAAFARGDFTTPGAVHAAEVPGARVMAARRGVIAYAARDLPRGAEVRIVTADAEARRAVAEFLAFQRREHRAGGAQRR